MNDRSSKLPAARQQLEILEIEGVVLAEKNWDLPDIFETNFFLVLVHLGKKRALSVVP